MRGRYIYRTDFMFSLSAGVNAAEHNLVLVLQYTVSPGCEATRDQPGEGSVVIVADAHIESGQGTIYRRTEVVPNWLWPFIEGDEELQAEMLAHAAELDEYARDQAADAKREEQMLEARS